MELLIQVSPPRGETVDLRVSADPASSVQELLEATASHLGIVDAHGARLARTGQTLAPQSRLTDARIVQGDRLILSADGAGGGQQWAADAAFELQVTAGPDAGDCFPLRAGAGYLVGREGADLCVDDPRMSRVHLHLGVGSKVVMVSDMNSSNGTFIDGRRITQATELKPGQVLEAGASLFTIARATQDTPAATAQRPWVDGRVPFARPPRVTRPVEPLGVKVPAPPIKPGKRKIPLSAALIPVLMGVVMYFVAGPQMLFLALLSPVMLLFTTWEDARSGRLDYGKRLKKWGLKMDELEAEVLETHATRLAERRASGPGVAELAERVRDTSPQLWERRYGDSDFLTLRLGTTDLPSTLFVDAPRRDGPVTEDDPLTEQEIRIQKLEAAISKDLSVPADVALPSVGALGLSGEHSARARLLSWLVMQAAVLHSPRELGIVALLSSDEKHAAWDWIRWLPHTETLLQGVPGARSVATSPDDVRALAQAVEDLIDTRRLRAERGVKQEAPLPWLLVVIPDETVLAAPTLSRLLAQGANYGVSFLVSREAPAQLPGECKAVVKVGSDHEDASVTLTASGTEVTGIILDGMADELTRELALDLAPLYDSTASSAAGEVPRQVLMLDVLGLPEPKGTDIQARWQAHAGTGELGAPIGMGAAGPVNVDLRRDGPHGLTAGTTGSGKSEMLLGYLGALAANYPASTLTFVLVDYKGGAAFKDCVALPHTVGFFTDLDPHLAQRALVSLNAELRRREHILSRFGCKDLIDMERRNPSDAPANLFIVFDEFAFLKKEVPEFVAGVIDIAQRGRSLGVHLMLATQRPAGVIDDNIRANTNLRIALRMANPEESHDVLDRDDAARIPKGLPGRGFVRVGHSDVTLVQSSYASARTKASGPVKQPTKVGPFPVASGLIKVARKRGSSEDDSRPTDLQRLVEAIREAHVAAGIPDQPRPWLDPMPELIDLATLSPDAPEGASDIAHPIGMLDLPAEQAQETCWYDPSDEGSLLVYGTSGTGKSQLLRTIAASVSERYSPDDVHLYGLDFAGRGLAPITPLPHTGGVVTADEPGRVDRLLDLLDGIVAERTELLGQVNAASLAEYRASGGKLPWILVFVDGYGAFRQAYLNIDRGEQLDRFDFLVSHGRAVGVLFVITADRRSAVPAALSSAISSRMVLRMADADEYASLGLPSALAQAKLSPGRGFLNGQEVQVAVLGEDASGAAQAAALTELSTRVTERFAGSTLPAPVSLLPDELPAAQLPQQAATLAQVWLGLSGDTYQPVALDLDDNPLFMVVGSSRSGRTSALETVAAGVVAASPGIEAYLLAPRRTTLSERGWWQAAAQGVEACEELIEQLEARLREKQSEPVQPWLVVIDDGDELVDTMRSNVLETMLRRSRDVGLVFIAAATTHSVQRAFGGWVTSLRNARHGIILDPQADVDGDLFGVRLPRKSSRRFPPGRGYLIARGPVEYVQVAMPEPPR